MKKYVSHKTVEAMKITDILGSVVGWEITGDGETTIVDSAWEFKHQPQVGGYLVRYADGYLSYSPAKAFEEGYTEYTEVAE